MTQQQVDQLASLLYTASLLADNTFSDDDKETLASALEVVQQRVSDAWPLVNA